MPILHFPRAFIQIVNVLEDNNIRVPQEDACREIPLCRNLPGFSSVRIYPRNLFPRPLSPFLPAERACILPGRPATIFASSMPTVWLVHALSLGIAPDVVMKWTGHADYKAMRPYIDIVDSIKAESMTKFNNLL